jgi:three-Cys-motif partner protein
MSELDSQVAAVQLPPEKLPAYHAHHRAKHELLRRYMDVWMPKLEFSYSQVALVDGFASAGRYRDGQRGSPLLMLNAYVGRTAADRAPFKRSPHFIFIERRKDYAQHLKAEVESYPTTHDATADVIHGSYEAEFPKVVPYLASAYRQPVPTFAFVDPRGYADNPFSHIAGFSRRLPNKSEVMVYVPAAFMARFLACSRSRKRRTSRSAARGIWTHRTCGNGRYARLSRPAISKWSSPRGVQGRLPGGHKDVLHAIASAGRRRFGLACRPDACRRVLARRSLGADRPTA